LPNLSGHRAVDINVPAMRTVPGSRALRRCGTSSTELDAGMVMVDLPTAGVDYHVPWRPHGSSYRPREQGRHAVLRCKTVEWRRRFA
jgi:hypothetical protein